MLAPVEGEDSPWPPAFLRGLVGADGRYAVYAYPSGDIWAPATQEAFMAAMEAVDPGVSGMPWIGRHMTELSRRSMRTAAWVGGLLVVGCVFASFRRVEPALFALLPTVLTIAGLHGLLRLMGHPLNPLNIMALPVVLGVAVDDGVHMVHRFLREEGDVRRTLAGSGRGVVLTSLTTIAAFGSLVFTRHRGLSSFALVLVLGVAYALVLSVLLLPGLLQARRASLLKPTKSLAAFRGGITEGNP
jgi:predicted RND superfamily exporter protein